MKINALKPSTETGYLVTCDVDDPDATEFSILYQSPGQSFASSVELQSITLAKRVAWAMDAAFEEGKKAAFAELRQLIGAK